MLNITKSSEDVQSKTTTRYHLIPVRMATIKKQEIGSVGQGGTLCAVGENDKCKNRIAVP